MQKSSFFLFLFIKKEMLLFFPKQKSTNATTTVHWYTV